MWWRADEQLQLVGLLGLLAGLVREGTGLFQLAWSGSWQGALALPTCRTEQTGNTLLPRLCAV